MVRMHHFLFPLTFVMLTRLSAGDSNARIQSQLTAPQPPRPLVSNHSPGPDKASRRTFVTALLAAEVAYLESLLSKQKAKKPKPKAPKLVSNHVRRPNKVRLHQLKPTPAYKPPTTTTEYVSKLDPFYMITAPDLSVKSASYKTDPITSHPAPVVTEPAPLPTYGAYQEYKVAPPVASTTTEAPNPTPTTTLKYGDFELYQPKGYLPPPPPKKPAAPKYPPAYKTPAKQTPEPKPVTYRPSKSYLPPIKKKPKTTKAQYKPPKGYLPPLKRPKPAYKKAPASPPKYEAPIPTYKKLEPAPVTYRPAKGYLPPKQASAPSYKAIEPPKTAAPVAPPKYEAPVATTEPPNDEAESEAPEKSKIPAKAEEQPTYEAPAIPVYQPTTPSAAYKPNPHPHTFFHDAQAEKVHKGDWPPIYYNSLHGTARRRRRL